MTNHKKEAVEYCLNTFNFELVHKVMEQVNWMWATRDGLKVPTIVQLILAAQGIRTQGTAGYYNQEQIEYLVQQLERVAKFLRIKD